MTQNPRSRLLRRARIATAGIVIAAVCGTAGLTALTAAGAPGWTDQATSDTDGTTAPDRSTGGVTAPDRGAAQGGSNAS